MKHRWIGAVTAPSLAPRQLQHIVDRLLPGTPVQALRPLTGGFRNHNFCVEHNGEQLVLRVHMHGALAPRKERALGELLSSRLHTPRTLDLQEVGDHTVTLRTYEAGQPLHEALQAGLVVDAGLGAALGKVLATLHAVEVEGHGDLDEKLRVVEPYLLSTAGLLAYAGELSQSSRVRERLGGELADAALGVWQREIHRLSVWTARPVLTHCDFGPTNLILRPDGDIAVIDWEFAAGGTPAFDFGNLLRPPLEDRGRFAEGLARGYTGAGGELPRDWTELAALVDVVAWLQFASRDECHPLVAADARQRLQRAVGASG